MKEILPISQWTEKDSVLEGEFLLLMEDYPEIYKEAEALYQASEKQLAAGNKPEKAFPKLVEQLSPKGLALTSYLYSQKDLNVAQPLVASTVNDLYHIFELMDDAPKGTSCQIIFQPTDPVNLPWDLQLEFSRMHKIVIHILRGEQSIKAIHIDSTNNPHYTLICMAINDTLVLKGNKEKRKATPLQWLSQCWILNEAGDPFSRQNDSYQCSTFAVKDARLFTTQPSTCLDILQGVQERNPKPVYQNPYIYEYPPPIAFYKNVQSRKLAQKISAEHGDVVVTRKGHTLTETHTRHNQTNYAHHFSLKLKSKIQKFIRDHSSEHIKAVTERYDVGRLTLAKLIDVYGPKQRKRIAC